jgi:hypothetical protein
LLIDLVSFSGEKDMLKAHLKHMNADMTIVYESTRSFTGLPKTITDLSDLTDERVVHYIIDGGTDSNPWVNEYAFRREGFAYLLSLGFPDEAVMTMCDPDEFLDVGLLREDLCVWNVSKYQMSARWFQKKEWASISGQLKHFAQNDIVDLIKMRHTLPVIDGGWHLSSFFTLEELRTKWRNFSHQELVRENMDDWVEHCWLTGKAVEDGLPMTELDVVNVPEAVLGGPAYWFRGREDAS